MALQGDGNGIVTIPLWTATGDFSISGFFEHTVDTEIFLGYNSAGNEYIGQINNNTISIQVGAGTASIPLVPNGEDIPFTLSRTGSTVSYDFNNGEVTGSFTSASTFRLDRFLTYNNGALKYQRKLSGVWAMVGDAGGTRTYDMEGSGTTLVDTTSAQNGTLSGFTTGGFTAPAESITITSVVDDQFRKRDANNQAIFTISGDIVGTATTVEVNVGGTGWVELDASPTTTYSGDVTVTNEQDVEVRFSNLTNVTAIALRLKAAFVIAAWGQSNEQGAGVNNQTVTIGSGKPTPAMYVQGVFSTLTDPTGYHGFTPRGSMWARISQLYSDAGIPIGLGNVAEGGSTIDSWKIIGQNYSRITQFANAVGGLSLAVSVIGETDSANGTETSVFKSKYLDVATALNSTYGVDVFATYFPVGTSTGTAPNVAKIRAAYDELIAENLIIKDGGDLSVIDISSGLDPLNDNLHLRLDADITTGANIRYAAFNFVESTLNFTVTGLSSTTRTVKYIDWVNDVILKTEVTSFDVSGNATASLNVAASTVIVAGYLGSNPPTTGTGIYGVTV